MNAHELKSHIEGVRDTVKITRAMQMIATSKLYRAREKCESSYRYLKELKNALSSLSESEALRAHPFLRSREDGKTALFIAAADKGLCGDFNHRIFEFADSFIEERGADKIFALGQATREHYAKRGIPLSNYYVHMAQEPHAFDAISVANDMLDMFSGGEYKEIYLLYTRTPTPSSQVPTAKKLLPIDLPERSDAPAGAGNTFEPDTPASYTNFLSQYVMAEIYSALADSAMALLFKRMTSMQQSTENGEKLLSELTARYNHRRQESITNELVDASAASFREGKEGDLL